jgi:hypothetical protein
MLLANKHDIASIEKLSYLKESELSPLIPQLMEWLQDGNWPVALPVSHLLAKAGDNIIPPLVAVLHGQDDIWKYWCIQLLVKKLPQQQFSMLLKDLVSLAQNPTAGEILEEVHIAAAEAISGFSTDNTF